MQFFKHFTDAHEGKSIIALMNEFGLSGYAAYFILVEICAKKLSKEASLEFTEDQLKFTFNERLVREKLRMRSTKLELFLNSCVTLDLLQFTKVKDELHFSFPKILESLDRDSKRARPVRDIAAPKIKNKIKIKEIEKEEDISTEASSTTSVVTAIPITEFSIEQKTYEIKNSVIQGWYETYDAEFVNQEIKKARNWLLTNPHKAPKSNLARFFNSWLARGWDKYRTSFKSNPRPIDEQDFSHIFDKKETA